MEKIEKFVQNIFEKKISPIIWLVNFLGIIAVRLFLDKFIANANTPLFDLIMDIHNVLFFFLTFFLVWLFVSLILGEKPFKLAYIMAWASLFIVFPPIFDLIATRGEVYWSFYLISPIEDLFWQFITIFGHLPSGIVYFGTKITFISAIILLSGLVYIRLKSPIKAFLTAIGTYSILFFMAAFPSIMAYLVLFLSKEKKVLDIQPFEIVQFFANWKVFGVALVDPNYSLAFNLNFAYFLLIIALLALAFYWSDRIKFQAIAKNFRYPQLIYHSGLLLCGAGLGFLAYPGIFSLTFLSFLAFSSLLVSVWLSWKASVVVNDLNDTEIDRISNKSRPLPNGIFEKKQFKELGIVVFILALIGGFALDYKFGMLLIIYQVLAWFYSAQPYRLKKIPILATFLSSLASLVIFMMGFILFSPGQSLDGFSWRIFFLLLIAYTLCLPIKDFKDIAGDKTDGVKTIPVIFGEEKGRLIVAIGFFVSFMLSVFFLNEMGLFWWALLFGGISFLVITNKKIKPYNLLWWNLVIAFVYGLILVKIIFL